MGVRAAGVLGRAKTLRHRADAETVLAVEARCGLKLESSMGQNAP